MGHEPSTKVPRVWNLRKMKVSVNAQVMVAGGRRRDPIFRLVDREEREEGIVAVVVMIWLIVGIADAKVLQDCLGKLRSQKTLAGSRRSHERYHQGVIYVSQPLLNGLDDGGGESIIKKIVGSHYRTDIEEDVGRSGLGAPGRAHHLILPERSICAKSVQLIHDSRRPTLVFVNYCRYHAQQKNC